MSDNPNNREDPHGDREPGDFPQIDRALLTVVSHRQRDNTPLSLDQEHLLDDWVAGRLSASDADRAAELAKLNYAAAERVLERRLITVANAGPEVPSALSARILRASPLSYSRAPASKIFGLRFPSSSVWQWSGLGAAAAAIVAVFGLQIWHMHVRSEQGFQIAMVTIEDRSALSEGAQYRTRGRRPRVPTSDGQLPNSATETHFSDLEVPIGVLRHAIEATSDDKKSSNNSELLRALRAQSPSIDGRSIVLIDSMLADDIARDAAPDVTSAQVRVFNLDDPNLSDLRSKLRSLPPDAHAILLSLRR
jgi:hypothetical protein